MVALAQEPVIESPPPVASEPADVSPEPVAADGQRVVEQKVLRSILIGASIGIVVCAAIWIGLVWLASLLSDTSLVPMLWVGLGCGVFAGLFLGGSAGALAGSAALEHYEKQTLPPRA